MSEIFYIVVTFILGMILGILFFGGLWFTMRKALLSKLAPIWFFLSFIFRAGISMLGFYYCALDNWQGFPICIFGFIVARQVIKYLIKVNEASRHGEEGGT